MITTSNADGVLKSYYLDAVSEQLDKSANPFLAAVQKTTSDVWGKDVRKAVRFGMSGGIGAGAEDGTLPAPTGTNFETFVSPLKNLFGTIEITDKALRASEGSEGAFVNLLNSEMNDLVRSSSYNLGRMLFGDGSGKLAVSAGTDGTVDTVQYLAEGMVVDVYAAGGTVSKAAVTIESVDRAAKKVTFRESVALAEGSFLVVQNSYNRELTGLKAIFATEGTLYGVDRTGKTWLSPYEKKLAGESNAISENIVQAAIDAVEERSGGKTNFIVCSWGVRRALINALAAYRRMEPVELAGGHTALSFNGIPVVADRFCPAGTMYLLNTDDFALHQLCDWQWLENEDGKILKQIPGKAAFTATLVKYAELMCYRPIGQGAITNIKEE